jgi:hypothetical protein
MCTYGLVEHFDAFAHKVSHQQLARDKPHQELSRGLQSTPPPRPGHKLVRIISCAAIIPPPVYQGYSIAKGFIRTIVENNLR